MLLYESNYRYLDTNFVRVFDTDEGTSKTIEVPKKWEYYLPCDNGSFKAVCSKKLMKKFEGYWKDTKDSYSPISPVDRYIRDNFWKKAYNENPRIWYLDIETRVTRNEFPSPDKAAEQISLIQIYDNILNKVIIIGYKDFKMEPGYSFDVEVKYIKCTDENDMIQKYFMLFKKLNPLIIYAWNGDGFDFPYLCNRFSMYGYNSANMSNYYNAKLTEINGEGRKSYDLSANGHYYIDLMKVYKKFTFTNLPSYSLNYVSTYELNETKVEHDEFNDFDSFYTGKNYTITGKPYDDSVREQIRQLKIKEHDNTISSEEKIRLEELITFQFVYYGIKDVILLKRIDDKKKFTNIMISIAKLMGCSIIDTLGTIKPWSIGLKNMFYENNYISDFKRSSDDVNIVGGFVREPVYGIHGWMGSEDVNSMYPMLSMKGFNMSPETYIPINELAPDLREHITKYYFDQNESKILNYSDDIKNETKRLLNKYNVSLAINGAVFDKSSLGIVPKVVSDIYFGRKNDKKLMLKYEQQAVNISDISVYGINTTNDYDKIYTKEELSQFNKETLDKILEHSYNNAAKLDTQQIAKKVLINALYGALGNIYFSMFNQYIAQAITGNGRLFIQLCAQNLENFLQNKIKYYKPYIIYGDTDSFYFQLEPIMKKYIEKNPGKSINDYVNAFDKIENEMIQPIIQSSIKEFAELLNAYDISAINMKRECIADKCCFVAKKKYIARVRDSEGVRYPDNEPHMKVMGLELARSTTPNWCKEKLSESINYIFESDEETLKKWIQTLKSEILNAPIDDIAMHGGVSMSSQFIITPKMHWMAKASVYFNKYIDKNNLKSKYSYIDSGDKVSVVFLNVPNKFGTDILAYNSYKFIDEFKDDIDYATTFEKGFLNPLNNIVKVLGYDIYSDNAEVEDW